MCITIERANMTHYMEALGDILIIEYIVSLQFFYMCILIPWADTIPFIQDSKDILIGICHINVILHMCCFVICSYYMRILIQLAV